MRFNKNIFVSSSLGFDISTAVRVRENDHGTSTGRYLYGYGFFLKKFSTGKVWVKVIFEILDTEQVWVNKKN